MRHPQLNEHGELRHLLTTEGLPKQNILQILDTASSFLEVSDRQVKKVPLLRGKSVFNVFFEPSTRTRTTFEIAAKRLSADVINLNVGVSSTSKGETLLDTVYNLQAMDAEVDERSAAGELLGGEPAAEARDAGAAEIVDPTPFAVGSIAATYAKYPNAKGILPAMQESVRKMREAGVDVTGLQTKLNALKSKTITVTTNFQMTGANKQALYEADGGTVAGRGFGTPRGSDTVPAMLTPGEFVVRSSAVQQFGRGFFSQLNRGINPLAGMTPTAPGRNGGFSIGTIVVQSAPGERADSSLPRALRRQAFLAGVNG